MFYIKLENNMDLVITQREPIYRGDNLNQKIRYLIPETVGEIDVLGAAVYLSCVRADGTADIHALTRLEDMYNGMYYQYVLPVDAKMTRYAGEVCTWLQIMSGPVCAPVVAKSGECILRVQESKDLDDYLGDRQIAAIYEMSQRLANKADDLIADNERQTLQLSADGKPIGKEVDMSKLSGGDIIHFDEKLPPADPDEVIHF